MIGPRPCLMVLAAGTAMLVALPSCETNSRALVTSPPSAAAQKSPTTTTGAAPDKEIGGGAERPVVDGALLTPGAHYRATGTLQDIDVVLRGPSSPLYSQTASHYLGLSADRAALDTIVSVLPIGGVRTFRSPEVERSQLDDHTVGAITDESPPDIIAWLARRSFLNASAIDGRLHIGSFIGRGFHYTVTDLPDQAEACGPLPAPRCAPTLWASGIALHVTPGEQGTMAEIAVAGQPVLIMMTEGQPTAEVLASLRFEIHRVPARAGAALRLPYYAPTLPPGRYYIDKVSTKVGLLVTASAADLTASQRTDLAWFGDAKQSPAARHYYFVAADAQTVAANEDPALDPYALAGPTGIVVWQLEHFLARTRPLPDDPLAWLSRQPYLHVIRPVHEERVGASQARVVDVRANPATGGIPCPDGRGHCAMPFAHIADAFPIVISSEYVTRVVDLAVGSQHIIVAADLGTPGASLLSSLCAFRLDKPVAGPPCG